MKLSLHFCQFQRLAINLILNICCVLVDRGVDFICCSCLVFELNCERIALRDNELLLVSSDVYVHFKPIVKFFSDCVYVVYLFLENFKVSLHLQQSIINQHSIPLTLVIHSMDQFTVLFLKHLVGVAGRARSLFRSSEAGFDGVEVCLSLRDTLLEHSV